MVNGNNDNEIIITYTTNKIADSIGIGKSTINKYSRSLEEYGYIFYKDDRGNRAYTEHDIVTLRYLKELLEKGIGYSEGVEATAKKFNKILSSEVASTPIRYEGHYARLEDKIEKQNQLIKELIFRIEERDKKRDELLMSTIREIQNNKKLLLENKKWWKFWE